MTGKIIVVTHKDYDMPKDGVYLPICVGGEIHTLSGKFQPDNAGDNISTKNATYCELTAIYWAWKNLKKQDYIGVAHYRRHFSTEKHAKALSDAITGSEIETLFRVNDGIKNVVLTTPTRRYLSSVENHYIYSKKGYEEIHRNDIQRLRQALHSLSPEYDAYADKVLKGHSAHMLNMFIMSTDNFTEYCAWLFPIIDKVVALSEDREDQRRYAGALSEFCLDIWVKGNQYIFREVPLLETEKVPFFTKLYRYLERKFLQSK